MIDLDAIQSRLDRGVESLTDTHDLLREVELLRGEAGRERAAVVAWLRSQAEAEARAYTGKAWVVSSRVDNMADAIERGEHRREEE